eukprot:TRINITY_DN45937_c0_g1_i1.p1 TRINITY_DN45937_c0_g1~~TRINITY_DN45937_c0_g1_i1.p1  ORF type:complete len:124 (+),score=24.19 TRINITY_DN45937_c0_g1_i1:350-721(+)
MGAGDGGWPTIRYFNKETGYAGKPYKKKTDMEMCEELGDEDRMRAYIEDMSGATRCDIVWGDHCSEEELRFISKWADKAKEQINEEKNRWEKELAGDNHKGFAKKQRRVFLLNGIHKNENPEF